MPWAVPRDASLAEAKRTEVKRVFWIDLAHFPNFGGMLKIIAALPEAAVIERILTHLGLQARALLRERARRGCSTRPDLRLIPHQSASASGRWNLQRPRVSEAGNGGAIIRVPP